MSDNSGFRVYALDHEQHARTIKQRLMQIRATRVEFLADGAATDWAHYQRLIGFLQGIDEALQICDEIEKQERS